MKNIVPHQKKNDFLWLFDMAKNKTDLTMAKAIKLVKEMGVLQGDINAGQISINRDNQYNRTTGNQDFKGFRVIPWLC